MMSIAPSSVTSPTMAQIFVVPMSRPTRMSPLFAMTTTSGRVRASRFRPPGALSDPLPPRRVAAPRSPHHPRAVSGRGVDGDTSYLPPANRTATQSG